MPLSGTVVTRSDKYFSGVATLRDRKTKRYGIYRNGNATTNNNQNYFTALQKRWRQVVVNWL